MTASHKPPHTSAQHITDQLHRFVFEAPAIRGELVNLVDTYQQTVDQHDYPPAVKRLLGELLVACSLLTATLKVEGDISLQLQGDGPVSLAVIHGNQQQQLRGIARIRDNAQIAQQANLAQLMGQGYLVVTITPEHGERYQGVVELAADNLADCLNNYFVQSAQLATHFFLRHGLTEQQQPCLSGMLLQVLPTEQPAEQHIAFEHLLQLTQTITGDELARLPIEQVLYRLYHQEDVRLFAPQSVAFHCHCSAEKSLSAVKLAMSQAEIDEMIQQQGYIAITCEYCYQQYHLTKQCFIEH